MKTGTIFGKKALLNTDEELIIELDLVKDYNDSAYMMGEMHSFIEDSDRMLHGHIVKGGTDLSINFLESDITDHPIRTI